MRGKKLIALLLALMLVGALLAGCAQESDTEAPDTGAEEPAPSEPTEPVAQEQYLNHYFGDEPPDLNPLTTTDTYSFTLLNAVSEGLVRQGLDGAFAEGSGLAESWEVSDDGTTWTFTLRDTQWSNGDPLEAEDFVNAWKYVIDPRNAASYAYQLYHIVGAAEVNGMNPEEVGDEAIDAALEENVAIELIDEKTFSVTLERPTPFFTSLLAFPTYFPVNWDFYQEMGGAAKLGGNYGTEVDTMLYIGPYVMTEWIHDSEIVLEKNPNYWDADAVNLDLLHFDIIPNNSTAVNMYAAGDIDRVGIGADFLDEYLDDPNVSPFPDASTWYIQLNQDVDIFKNPKIRRALSLAIDRQVLSEDVQRTFIPSKGYTNSLIHDLEGNIFVDTWLDEPVYPANADVEEAQRLLAEGLAEEGLSAWPGDIELLTDDSDTARRRDQALQEMWRQNLGIEIALDAVDFQTRLERSRQRQYDMVFSGWGPDYDDPQTFLDMWVTDGPFNEVGYSNRAFDAAIQAAQDAGTDNKARMEAFAEAERILAEDAPILVINERVTYMAMQPYVKDLKISAVGAEYDYKWVDTSARP